MKHIILFYEHIREAYHSFPVIIPNSSFLINYKSFPIFVVYSHSILSPSWTV